jgi:hypothetical protein
MEFVIGLVVGSLLTLFFEHYKEIERAYANWKSKRIYENSLDLTRSRKGVKM